MKIHAIHSLALLLGVALPAQGKVFMTVPEALELAFPDCKVKRETIYLTKDQRARITKVCGERFAKGIVFRYVAEKKGVPAGTAYFDVHRVRTQREVVMIVVSPANKVARIEVLKFGEPVEYVPHTKWYHQFLGRSLDAKLAIKRGIRGVTGATLTARATTRAARRVLAIHETLRAAKKRAPEKHVKGKPAAKKPAKPVRRPTRRRTTVQEPPRGR